jgi:hypothetical protein
MHRKIQPNCGLLQRLIGLWARLTWRRVDQLALIGAVVGSSGSKMRRYPSRPEQTFGASPSASIDR